MVTGAGLSVVVTVTVTVTVACPFPTASFWFTDTPVGAGDIAELCMTGVEIPGYGCNAWEEGSEACLLFSLDKA